MANQATLTAGLGTVPCPREAGWRAQFACPTGWLGVLVGHLMALKNRERSAWVLSKLSLDEGDRVLEIGSGPGADLREAARRAGYVTGIDPSEVMVRQARRRSAVGREIAGALTSAGFSNVSVSFKKMRPVATACVTATR